MGTPPLPLSHRTLTYSVRDLSDPETIRRWEGAHFFSDLRVAGCAFPSELPVSLGDVFGGGLEQVVRNAVAAFDYEWEAARQVEAGRTEASHAR
jgi:hypothetical protein